MNDIANHEERVRHEFMVYVERIVRPIRASQARRLRMRTELLAHLQAALVEQRVRCPGDEALAIESTKRRLGEPLELARTLQQSVPAVERVLMARAPLPSAIEELERRGGRLMYGVGVEMTGVHTAMLAAAAGLISGVPVCLLQTVRDVLTRCGAPVAHVEPFLAGMMIGLYALMLVSYRFVFKAAAPSGVSNCRGMLWRGAVILAMQIGLTCFAAATGAGRPASAGELIASALATIAALAIAASIARRIGILRRPYDPWLSLKIAD